MKKGQYLSDDRIILPAVFSFSDTMILTKFDVGEV